MSDFWNDAKSVLATVAPTLATALGGPLAGQATNWIITALGLAPDTPAGQVAQAVQAATPDQLLALKRADQDFTAKMRELEVDVARLTNEDRAGARDRERTVKDWMPRALGLGIVGGFLAMTATTLMGEAKVDSTLAGVLIGYLSGKAEQVISYYFGSSAGSASKESSLADSVPAHIAVQLAQAGHPLALQPGADR